MNSDFELINIADEHLAVPVGEAAVAFSGVVALSEAAFSVLQQMKQQPKTKDELVQYLISTYNIDETAAKTDIDTFLHELNDIGLIE